MVPCSKFIWITNSSDHRRFWTTTLLYTKFLPNPLGHKTTLCNDFVCKRFAVQTLLWSLEFGIQIYLEHDTIAIKFFFICTFWILVFWAVKNLRFSLTWCLIKDNNGKFTLDFHQILTDLQTVLLAQET